MEFVIIPNQSVGSICFGMTPDEVRNTLDSPCESDFFPSGNNVSDSFPELAISVSYESKPPYRCYGVLLMPFANAIFQDRSLSFEDYEETCLWLSTIDNSIEEAIDYIGFDTLGITLYNPRYCDYMLWLDRFYTTVSAYRTSLFV
jgi:hypothetical protein